ncbi:MAG: hypothetical protein AAF298_01115 [Cyanobacteria bacterium P01_A01_bin.40]
MCSAVVCLTFNEVDLLISTCCMGAVISWAVAPFKDAQKLGWMCLGVK